MFKSLRNTVTADKPLSAMVTTVVLAVATTVCNALGVGHLGTTITAVVDSGAAGHVLAYIVAEAHKAAAAIAAGATAAVGADTNPTPAPAGTDPAQAAVAEVTNMVAAGLSQIAQSLQTKTG